MARKTARTRSLVTRERCGSINFGRAEFAPTHVANLAAWFWAETVSSRMALSTLALNLLGLLTPHGGPMLGVR